MAEKTYTETFFNRLPKETGSGLRKRTLTEKGEALAGTQISERLRVTQPHQPQQSDGESLQRKINELPELPELPEMHVVSGQTEPPVYVSVLDRPIASCSGSMSLPTTTDPSLVLPSLTDSDVQSFFTQVGQQQFYNDMRLLATHTDTVHDALFG